VRKPLIDFTETEKSIRSIFNKVSEGNIEPMFKQLLEVVNALFPKDPATFAKAYAGIFYKLSVKDNRQMMNAILSVNCVYVCALQRLFGGRASANKEQKDLGNFLFANICK